jgi:hypothetical protein
LRHILRLITIRIAKILNGCCGVELCPPRPATSDWATNYVPGNTVKRHDVFFMNSKPARGTHRTETPMSQQYLVFCSIAPRLLPERE